MHSEFLRPRNWPTLCVLAVLCACAVEREAADAGHVHVSAGLALVSATPDTAAPLWVRSPIVLRFSAPLDPASVSAGVRLDSTSGPVEVTQQLAGETLTLQIKTPPLAPNALTLSISADLRDQAGHAAQPLTRSWQLPLWHTSTAEGVSARPPLLAHAGAATWLAWETETFIQLARYADQQLRNVEALPVEAGAHLSDIVIDGEGRPVVAWSAGAAHAARYGASGWQPLDAGLDAALGAGPALGPRLARSSQDPNVIAIAWGSAAGVELASWSLEGPWQRMAQPITTAPIHAIDLAWPPSGAVLAALVERSGGRDFQVQRLESAAWRTLSEALEHDRNDDVRELAIDAAASGALLVSWTEVTDGASQLYVSRYAEETASFQALGPALNVALESSAQHPVLAAGDGTSPVVAFQELSAGEAANYVARWNGSGFEILGGSFAGRNGPSLSLGANAQPMAASARADTGAIELHQYNESPTPPFGLSERKPLPCTLPPDSDPAFPQLLSQTSCYANLSHQTVADGWIPYDLNSPLWSDGAAKRRFLAIPDNTTIGYTDTEAWELPVGTMLAKEFWLQREPSDPTTRYIVETRLLIKRCEPGSCRASWQGYSYQWNSTADEATLLTNNQDTVLVDWPIAGGMHKHSYPGRDECTRCHALSAGGALGPRTQQLNRNHRYGDVVDNQLRALFHAGLFGATPPPADFNSLTRLPTPADPSYDLNARVRGYFDANCSHCHSPTSRWPVIDLRYDAMARADDGSGMTGNICNMIVLGSAEASILYVKLKAVPGAVPEGFPGDTMPPIGRLLPDDAQLPRIKTWIERMTTCP